MTTVKERPILFSTEMVRAVLDGRKTMTRRVVKHQPPCDECRIDTPDGREWCVVSPSGKFGQVSPWFKCPYGVPGDRLWVKEAWAVNPHMTGPPVAYKASPDSWFYDDMTGFWKPSRFMPRWASRILLEVTGVRVERLQEITCGDAVAEGMASKHVMGPSGWEEGVLAHGVDWPKYAFIELWDSINAERGHPWESNPWVWVIEFKVLEEAK